MGMRMSVKSVNSDEEFGDDHKLYGYYPYETVRSSFDTLYPFMACQWDSYNYDDWDEPAKEAYELLCMVSGTHELEVDSDTFRVFTKRYIKDMKKAKKSEQTIKDAEKYLGDLCKEPGNKILYWC